MIFRAGLHCKCAVTGQYVRPLRCELTSFSHSSLTSDVNMCLCCFLFLPLSNSGQKLHDNSINDYAEPRSAAGLPANAVIDSNSEPAGNQRNCPY
jgi:hypothetical protein